MSQEKLEKVVSQIRELPDHFYLDGAISAQVKFAGIETTLMAAAICARADIIHYVVDNFGANSLQTYAVSSDRHRGETSQVGLLECALNAYLTRPDSNRTSEGQKDLLEAVKYLATKRLPLLPNPDPLEGPLPLAHFLANPELANDNNHPYFDLIPQCANELPPEKFTAVYNYLKDVRPNEIKKFEEALEKEISNLKSEFHAAQRREDGFEDRQNPRPIGEVLKGITPHI